MVGGTSLYLQFSFKAEDVSSGGGGGSLLMMTGRILALPVLLQALSLRGVSGGSL